jgi:hypothetical protein
MNCAAFLVRESALFLRKYTVKMADLNKLNPGFEFAEKKHVRGVPKQWIRLHLLKGHTGHFPEKRMSLSRALQWTTHFILQLLASHLC